MKNYQEFRTPIQFLFCDIDDTLTHEGKLGPKSYEMLWKLADLGLQIIPVTGRPAGWCELIARLWPVRGVIGENGAFYFSYQNKKMKRHFIFDNEIQEKNRAKLDLIQKEVLETIPGTALASDQFTRLFDLAIDFCEDVPPLPESAIEDIVKVFKKHGATAKVSSIHVNGWFGDYDKRSMCETFYEAEFGHKLAENQKSVAFVGDSPNDEPLFGFFDHSFAVSNIKKFLPQLKTPPKYLLSKEGGLGFYQLGERLIENLDQ